MTSANSSQPRQITGALSGRKVVISLILLLVKSYLSIVVELFFVIPRCFKNSGGNAQATLLTVILLILKK